MRPREVLDDLQSDGALLPAAEEEVPRDGSGHDGSGESKRHGSCDHLRMQLSRVSEWVNDVATTITTTHTAPRSNIDKKRQELKNEQNSAELTNNRPKFHPKRAVDLSDHSDLFSTTNNLVPPVCLCVLVMWMMQLVV